ncbi:MarR family winged helix-turn-helix transcriptional regulator [Allobranchiibius sp. CTAmp26]|uniref:MarR family winged helix-turn-helix transcriptional regulator n=1 Tax=Allobranchiibius sp. CTAmp26 TaxID=2815214 RepID=UPI001AA0D33F|nr:MarR family winged helix-turn-helix transcriptional regulator [Allobranchiibius sp. CTAmp26]MBO1753929.1 winged helix-turn-helix transcriptional regulator [Allobranchiibius sp. CTAmp26]
MPGPSRTALHLSQLGNLAAARFAELTRSVGLTPSDAGVLRLLGRQPGISQRVLADRLGAVPSRVVVLLDSMEQRGLVTRTRSRTDRRTQELTLTEEGQRALGELRGLAERHDADVLAPLTQDERNQLGALLAKLSEGHRLDPDVHPGYRDSA